jgi:subtilisin
MVDIDPLTKLYVVRFLEKDKRPNKKDDKFEILRQEIGLRDTNNVLDLVKESARTKHSENKDNPNLAKDHQTIVDLNLYDIPSVHIKLTEDQAARLRRNPNVRWVYIPEKRTADVETTPWGITRVQADSLNTATRHTGYGVKVAVIDTGINYNHLDLKPNYKGGASFIPGISDPMDDNTLVETSGGQTGPVFHGSHCSGTICAAINNADVVGVAPTAWLYAAKVLDKNGSGTAAEVTQGFVWADVNDMDVLSASLGSSGQDPDESAAVASCFANGRFIAAAAGNDGVQELHFPASYAGVWSVGAVDQTDTLASFSSWGAPTDFVAPGVGILSDTGNKTTSGTRLLDGTSQATPHISGLAALAIANYRFSPCDTNVYSPTQTKLIHIAGAMIASCDTLGQTSVGVASLKYGFGMPQALALTELLTGVSN